jgi:hypothetical protein
MGRACASAALEPTASMKIPMIADAARPPISLTTLPLALPWRAILPLEAPFEALF